LVSGSKGGQTTVQEIEGHKITIHALPEKPGLGIELNPDVVKAHLAKGETYWD
jgi:L-alanine-DL-glutamate epimerase-like enolase superfamily enzyme